MTDSLNRKRQISDSFQREAEQIMKRCQRGTRNYEEANNLHAVCYGIIGKLLAQTEQDHIPDARKMVTEQEPVVGITAIRTWFKDGRVVTQTLCNSWVDTTPPQRTWVGLTDEEYKELHLQMGPVYYYQEYGQAIEAKLKEKNT